MQHVQWGHAYMHVLETRAKRSHCPSATACWEVKAQNKWGSGSEVGVALLPCLPPCLFVLSSCLPTVLERVVEMRWSYIIHTHIASQWHGTWEGRGHGTSSLSASVQVCLSPPPPTTTTRVSLDQWVLSVACPFPSSAPFLHVCRLPAAWASCQMPVGWVGAEVTQKLPFLFLLNQSFPKF